MPNLAHSSEARFQADYPFGTVIESHQHGVHQLIYASRGVLRVSSETETWIVPPGRAIWMPAHREHAITCRSDVALRFLYFKDDGDPAGAMAAVWSISPLMREVIIRLVEQPEYTAEEALLTTLEAEIESVSTLPLELPQPRSHRLLEITSTVLQHPHDKR
ncbi:MAG: cupin domain-containing protein, partial [Pseudomonadota bacterium]